MAKKRLPDKIYARYVDSCWSCFSDGSGKHLQALENGEDFAEVGETVRVGVYKLVGYADVVAIRSVRENVKEEVEEEVAE